MLLSKISLFQLLKVLLEKIKFNGYIQDTIVSGQLQHIFVEYLIKYGQKKKILKDYLIFFSISIFSKNL
jgi:hypothetical protein